MLVLSEIQLRLRVELYKSCVFDTNRLIQF